MSLTGTCALSTNTDKYSLVKIKHNILTDEGVIAETPRINWIEHFLMNMFYFQGWNQA